MGPLNIKQENEKKNFNDDVAFQLESLCWKLSTCDIQLPTKIQGSDNSFKIHYFKFSVAFINTLYFFKRLNEFYTTSFYRRMLIIFVCFNWGFVDHIISFNFLSR